MMRNRKSARPLIVLLVLMAIGFFIWMFMGQRPSTTSCPLAPADMYRFMQVYNQQGGLEAEMFVFQSPHLVNETSRAAVLGSSNYQNFYEQICGGDKCSGIALDVGAFTGTHSWFMAKAGFQVHAFEIYPVSFEILQCNAQLASHLFSGSPIKVTQQGVSSAIGTECLMQPLTSNPKASMLLGKNMVPACHGNQSIPVTTLDSYWETTLKKERIHFLKLDLEGHEQAALQGAAKMLKEAPPPYILMSYRHHVNTMKQVDMKEMLKMIYSVGYRVFDCDIQVEVKQGDSGIRLLGNYATSQKGTQLLLVLAPADDQSDLPRFMCSSAPE